MTGFDKAVMEYEAHFKASYPYAIGIGYPGKTDEENIEIIRKCIREGKPVDFRPDYDPNCVY